MCLFVAKSFPNFGTIVCPEQGARKARSDSGAHADVLDSAFAASMDLEFRFCVNGDCLFFLWFHTANMGLCIFFYIAVYLQGALFIIET